MKSILFSFIGLLLAIGSFAQDKLKSEIEPVKTLGRTIYKIEMANQLSNELIPQKYKGKEKVVGHFSMIESENIKTVFYAKGDKPKVLGTITYESTFDEKNAQVDLTEREMTESELDLMKLTKAANLVIADASSFNTPPNTRLTLVPINSKGEHKVYVMTISEKIGEVIFGNDFLLSFDNKYVLQSKVPLHKNMAAVTFDPEGGKVNDRNSQHVFVPETGDMITGTDFAILLLNEKATQWSHHAFISEKYLFFWNYAMNDLQIVPKGEPNKK